MKQETMNTLLELQCAYANESLQARLQADIARADEERNAAIKAHEKEYCKALKTLRDGGFSITKTPDNSKE